MVLEGVLDLLGTLETWYWKGSGPWNIPGTLLEGVLDLETLQGFVLDLRKLQEYVLKGVLHLGTFPPERKTFKNLFSIPSE